MTKFFQVKTLEKCLSKFVLNHSNDVDFIIDMINVISKSKTEDILMNVIDSSDLEKCLITKINDCLKSDKFNSLQMSQIYRIIRKSSVDTIDNNLLYEFIKQKINERFVLFSFLRIDKLSEINLKEIFSNYEKEEETRIYEYLPTDLRFIKSLKEKEELLNEKIKIIETQVQQAIQTNKELKSIKNENEQLKIQNKNQEEKIGNQMQQIVQKNKDFESQIESIRNENLQLKELIKNQKESEESIGNQMKNVKDENEKLKEKIKELTDEKENKIKLPKEIPYQRDFEGIFNFLRKTSNLDDEVKMTYPEKSDSNSKIVFQFENNSNVFVVRDKSTQWICF